MNKLLLPLLSSFLIFSCGPSDAERVENNKRIEYEQVIYFDKLPDTNNIFISEYSLRSGVSGTPETVNDRVASYYPQYKVVNVNPIVGKDGLYFHVVMAKKKK